MRPGRPRSQDIVMPPDPRIGVVIVTRDRAALLRATIARLLALPERPPVVVVDNGSADDTLAVARAVGVEVISLGENRGAAARNVGVRNLDRPYLAFADDDSWYEPGALARAANLFDAHPKLGLVAARVLVGPAAGLDSTCAAMAASPLPRRPGLPGPAVLGFLACGAVVRRSAFLSVGGFADRLGIGGEETLLAVDLAAAGWELAYVEEVVAHHHPPPRPDHSPRRRVVVRNALWSAWLRRRVPGVIVATAQVLARHVTDPAGRAGILDALRGLPATLRDRQPVPRPLDRQLRLIG
jgi:GT2 family glycosyltransferase